MARRRIDVTLTELEANALWSLASIGYSDACEMPETYPPRELSAGMRAMRKITEAQYGVGARMIGDR